MRIAAVGDLHCTRQAHGTFRGLFAEASTAADAVVLCGDLTDYGLPEEADVLADELSAGATVPVIAVLGNHDHESDQPDAVRARLTAVGAHVLDGEGVEIDGVGFAGTKGFAGGFGTHGLGAWGESAIKAFVQAAIEEELKLETSLGRLRTRHRVALLHYSPILQTVVGEPKEIYAWLGSTRLEEPIDRYEVTAAFHGHAHFGSLEGRTRGGVPVYNVSHPLLRANGHERGFRVVEVG
ncbi:MAG TPA: metallophosphoesterase [Candidatus Limnocylindria bacterium]|nr:metallophosphoesterase [Candidatus Limnocylindria bacterium]